MDVSAGLVIMTSTALAVGSFNHDDPLPRTLGYTASTLAGEGVVLMLVAERDPHSIFR